MTKNKLKILAYQQQKITKNNNLRSEVLNYQPQQKH